MAIKNGNGKKNPDSSLKELEQLERRVNRKYDFSEITDEDINGAVDQARREMSQTRRKKAA